MSLDDWELGRGTLGWCVASRPPCCEVRMSVNMVSGGRGGDCNREAGPVGESLIMTAIGLAVAVPAVLGYNWLVRRNKVAMEEVHAFGADLHAVLLGSAESGTAQK